MQRRYHAWNSIYATPNGQHHAKPRSQPGPEPDSDSQSESVPQSVIKCNRCSCAVGSCSSCTRAQESFVSCALTLSRVLERDTWLAWASRVRHTHTTGYVFIQRAMSLVTDIYAGAMATRLLRWPYLAFALIEWQLWTARRQHSLPPDDSLPSKARTMPKLFVIRRLQSKRNSSKQLQSGMETITRAIWIFISCFTFADRAHMTT